jgi:hypothetical protein
MSLSHETLMDLMALADGELEGAERARVEALLASDEEAKRVFEGLVESPLGDWVRHAQDTSARGAGADSIADAVMAAVAVAQEPTSLDAARAKRLRLRLLAATVVAVAAGVIAYVRTDRTDRTEGPGPAPIASNEAPRPTHTVTEPVGATPDPSWAQTGVDLEHVESPSAVSVFYVPAVAAPESANASSVVIWIDEAHETGKSP